MGRSQAAGWKKGGMVDIDVVMVPRERMGILMNLNPLNLATFFFQATYVMTKALAHNG